MRTRQREWAVGCGVCIHRAVCVGLAAEPSPMFSGSGEEPADASPSSSGGAPYSVPGKRCSFGRIVIVGGLWCGSCLMAGAINLWYVALGLALTVAVGPSMQTVGNIQPT